MNPARVRVDLSPRGAWEVVLPERVDRLRCKTLEEASRVAHRLAAARRPCELIVHDAYHRVVEHELIELGTETLTAIGAAVALREPGPDAAESRDEEADDSQTPRSDRSRAEDCRSPTTTRSARSRSRNGYRTCLQPGCRRSMPTNRAIATARRSASASPLYSLLPRAPPTRLRDPWGRRTRRPSPSARQDQPSPRTPLRRGRLLHTRLLRPPRRTSAWGPQRTAARGTDHAQHRDRTSHPIRSRNRHSPTTCSGRTKLLHRQGRNDSLRRVERDLRT